VSRAFGQGLVAVLLLGIVALLVLCGCGGATTAPIGSQRISIAYGPVVTVITKTADATISEAITCRLTNLGEQAAVISGTNLDTVECKVGDGGFGWFVVASMVTP
jgi:hypothetical protein